MLGHSCARNVHHAMLHMHVRIKMGWYCIEVCCVLVLCADVNDRKCGLVSLPLFKVTMQLGLVCGICSYYYVCILFL